MKKISLLEVKQALGDERFRNMFPEYQDEIKEFLKNPGCACNVSLYKKIMGHKDRLKQYFPTREIITPQEEIEQLSKNKWKVINCNIDELEGKLKKLNFGRKQVAVARWENMVTVIINDLDYLM